MTAPRHDTRPYDAPDDYSPFDESGLEEIALDHDNAARQFKAGGIFRTKHEGSAAMIRNAIRCHVALRARCLESEARAVLAITRTGEAP